MSLDGALPARMDFYVYEHWRPDTDQCFWVGKGNGDRAHRLKRNFHHGNVVAKLRSLGLKTEVRIVAVGLDEASALALEIERIAYWRSVGAPLTNYTDGGEGVVGLKHSEETRAKIRAKRALQVMPPCSEEKKAKIAAKQRGVKRGPNPEHSAKMRGRKQSPEHSARIAAAHRGHKRSAEARANMSAAQRGHGCSEEARRNMSLAHTGKKLGAETRQKMCEAQLERWKTADRSTFGRIMAACWADPEYRAKVLIRRAQAITSETRAKLSAAANKRWAAHRAQRSA